MENTFDKICARLFGEERWQQERKLKILLIVTVILSVCAVVSGVTDGARMAAGIMALAILIWGWGFVRAMMGAVGGIIHFFNNDIAVFVITVLLWVFLGLIGGVISLTVGIIRLIQIKSQ